MTNMVRVLAELLFFAGVTQVTSIRATVFMVAHQVQLTFFFQSDRSTLASGVVEPRDGTLAIFTSVTIS
jgi:hypothetical protein